MTIEVITHPAHLGVAAGEDLIDTAMRLIGTAFGDADEWPEKYGTTIENDVFLMHRFCWCEKEGECPWCTGCGVYQDRNECLVCANPNLSIEQRRAAPAEQCCDYSAGRGIFSRFAPWTLDHRRHYYDPPNFWYKPSNFRLTWYKYIGRDMAANADGIPGDFLHRIFATHPTGMTVEQAIDQLARRTDETRRAFETMLSGLTAPPSATQP